MELNEMEKRMLFQVEGDYQSKVLNEFHMTAQYTKNSEQRKTAESLITKLRVLTDAECMDIVRDIQEYSPKRENPRQVNPRQAKPEQAEPGQENPAQLNTNPLITKKSKTDISRTHPSIYPAEQEAAGRPDGMDPIELVDAYRWIIKESIEYDCMVSRYGKERLDEIMELMLEVVLSKRPYICIAGEDFPREVVKGRFLKINSGHMECVFDCIDRKTTKVGNIKTYLLAALYNAPATMDSYYCAEVNHDLYGC